jgi:hypothetical protein
LVRTSITHPLRIDDLPLGNGRLGITFCPGKKGDSVFGAPWDRNLDLDVDAIKGWGANAVLSLIDDQEFEMLGVPKLGEAVKVRGIDWFHHFRVWDLGTPTGDAMAGRAALSAQLYATLERGGRNVVNPRSGLCRGSRHRPDGPRYPRRHPPIATATVMRMTTIRAQTERNRLSRSARCAEKRGWRASRASLRASIRLIRILSHPRTPLRGETCLTRWPFVK